MTALTGGQLTIQGAFRLAMDAVSRFCPECDEKTKAIRLTREAQMLAIAACEFESQTPQDGGLNGKEEAQNQEKGDG